MAGKGRYGRLVVRRGLREDATHRWAAECRRRLFLRALCSGLVSRQLPGLGALPGSVCPMEQKPLLSPSP